MIKKVLVLIIVFSLIATAVAHENKNDGKDADPQDGDAGHGNDFRDKPHHGDGGDGGDDHNDGSDDGGSDDGGSDTGDDSTGEDSSDTGTGGGTGNGGSDTGFGTGSGSVSGSGIMILSMSGLPGGFSGSFGSGDCYRVSVWTKQLNNETLKVRARYNLQIIADEYDLTIDEFIKYKCSKTGLTFYPEKIYGGGGGSTWTYESNPTDDLSQPIPIPTLEKKKMNELLIRQITAGTVIFIILRIGFSYLDWRFRKLGEK